MKQTTFSVLESVRRIVETFETHDIGLFQPELSPHRDYPTTTSRNDDISPRRETCVMPTLCQRCSGKSSAKIGLPSQVTWRSRSGAASTDTVYLMSLFQLRQCSPQNFHWRYNFESHAIMSYKVQECPHGDSLSSASHLDTLVLSHSD